MERLFSISVKVVVSILFQKARKVLNNERGEANYFSTVVFIFIAVLLLAFIIDLFSIISTKQELDHAADQMVKQIQLSGGVNGETDDETVIMPLLKAHTIMMYRNLLYTGITRAKKRVVLIGQKQVLFMAIHRNEIGKRNTLLGMRIQMYFKAYAKKAGIPIPAVLEEQLKNAS